MVSVRRAWPPDETANARAKPADVVGQVLQANLGFRLRDADRPHDPTSRRVLLSTEHVFDASPHLALLVVRILLRFR